MLRIRVDSDGSTPLVSPKLPIRYARRRIIVSWRGAQQHRTVGGDNPPPHLLLSRQSTLREARESARLVRGICRRRARLGSLGGPADDGSIPQRALVAPGATRYGRLQRSLRECCGGSARLR